MLTFCEDCGERNILDSRELRENHNTFRCQVCNFLNTYHGAAQPTSAEQESDKGQPFGSALPAGERRKKHIHTSPFDRVFRSLEMEESVLGGFVYHFSEGVLCCDVAADMDEEFMGLIGKAMEVCCSYSHKLFPKSHERTVVMDDLCAVGRTITLNSVLVVFTSSHPVPPHLPLLLDKAQNNLQAFI